MIAPDPITYCQHCEGVIPDEEYQGESICLWCEAKMEREEESE